MDDASKKLDIHIYKEFAKLASADKYVDAIDQSVLGWFVKQPNEYRRHIYKHGSSIIGFLRICPLFETQNNRFKLAKGTTLESFDSWGMRDEIDAQYGVPISNIGRPVQTEGVQTDGGHSNQGQSSDYHSNLNARSPMFTPRNQNAMQELEGVAKELGCLNDRTKTKRSDLADKACQTAHFALVDQACQAAVLSAETRDVATGTAGRNTQDAVREVGIEMLRIAKDNPIHVMNPPVLMSLALQIGLTKRSAAPQASSQISSLPPSLEAIYPMVSPQGSKNQYSSMLPAVFEDGQQRLHSTQYVAKSSRPCKATEDFMGLMAGHDPHIIKEETIMQALEDVMQGKMSQIRDYQECYAPGDNYTAGMPPMPGNPDLNINDYHLMIVENAKKATSIGTSSHSSYNWKTNPISIEEIIDDVKKQTRGRGEDGPWEDLHSKSQGSVDKNVSSNDLLNGSAERKENVISEQNGGDNCTSKANAREADGTREGGWQVLQKRPVAAPYANDTQESIVDARFNNESGVIHQIITSNPDISVSKCKELIQDVRRKLGSLRGVPTGKIASAALDLYYKSGRGSTHSPLYRSQVCTYWQEGTCQEGEGCLFAHGREQLKSSASQFLCCNYKSGICKFNDKCAFSHDMSGAGSASLKSANFPKQESPEKPVVNEDCVICFIELGNDVETLSCGHIFHRKCIRSWLLNKNATCPNCRKFTLLDDDYPALK